MSNNVIVFTLNGCSHCVELKKELKKQQITFNEIEVGNNKEIWDKVVEQTGHNSLPTVFISLDGSDEGPVYVPGRDYDSREDLIKKIKIYV
jgi:glutaredoxin